MKEFLAFPRRLTAVAVLGGLAALAAPSSALAFEINFNHAHGTVIDDEYSSLGLKVFAKNNSGSDPDSLPSYAVVYDPGTSGQDPDLEQPFNDLNGDGDYSDSGEAAPRGYVWTGTNNTNPANFGYSSYSLNSEDIEELDSPKSHDRKILVVQENHDDSADNSGTFKECAQPIGVCQYPDDEGSGPNFLIFDFEDPVALTSIDLFDIDGGAQDEEARIAFFLEGHGMLDAAPDSGWELTNLDNKVRDRDPSTAGEESDWESYGSYFTVDSRHVGSEKSARFFFGDGVENVRRMVVAFSSSGAVTGLAGTTSVPEPGTLALLGVALAGMARVQRSRRST